MGAVIINTGMRTDIPACYSDWFFRRIREKYVLVRNPYYPQQVTRYRLTPDVVDCLAFCTKNPEPMLGRLDEISVFPQFWFVTITPTEKRSNRRYRTRERYWNPSACFPKRLENGLSAGVMIRFFCRTGTACPFIWRRLKRCVHT